MSLRAAGILLHPTSLPSRYGIGDLGPAAESFVDWLAAAGQRLWQVMPLGPTGYLNSPYGCRSAFAGNPLLISPERLVEEGLLPASALEDLPDLPADHVDFGRVIPFRSRLLRTSWEHFKSHAPTGLAAELEAFEASSLQADWLDDWALFASLARKLDGRPWTEWDTELVRREPAALQAARQELAGELAYRRYVQFLFFRQWESIRKRANAKGIQIFGDLPIYVAFGGADVWSNQQLFNLDERGRPLTVAGVPPDYFSKTGQLWGNPIYRWDRMESEGYRWWIARTGMNFRIADVVRIDHFRGFAGYWEVPAGEKTAIGGRWVAGPGVKLFEAIRRTYGDLPIVAEDLGVITDDVRELLAATGFPGMKVLQFAFGEDDTEYQPHHHQRNCVVYTGTHDNDTTRGWWHDLPADVRERFYDYLGEGRAVEWSLIRAAYTSVAERAIAPLQDVLSLGAEARMNTPGKAEGNWSWRASERQITEALATRLRRLAELTGRAKPLTA